MLKNKDLSLTENLLQGLSTTSLQKYNINITVINKKQQSSFSFIKTAKIK